MEYFLKWQSYSSDQNTWEPAKNLQCPELIKAFEDSFGKRLDNGKNYVMAYKFDKFDMFNIYL